MPSRQEGWRQSLSGWFVSDLLRCFSFRFGCGDPFFDCIGRPGSLWHCTRAKVALIALTLKVRFRNLFSRSHVLLHVGCSA